MALNTPLVCSEVQKGDPSLAALFARCIDDPSPGIRFFVAHPATLPEQWAEDAAYFHWLNKGGPYQENSFDRQMDFFNGTDALRATMPLGIAVASHDSNNVLQVIFFHFPGKTSYSVRRDVTDDLLDLAITQARTLHCVRVECLATGDKMLSDVLDRKGFNTCGRNDNPRMVKRL
jgi:hypothetical protein